MTSIPAHRAASAGLPAPALIRWTRASASVSGKPAPLPTAPRHRVEASHRTRDLITGVTLAAGSLLVTAALATDGGLPGTSVISNLLDGVPGVVGDLIPGGGDGAGAGGSDAGLRGSFTELFPGFAPAAVTSASTTAGPLDLVGQIVGTPGSPGGGINLPGSGPVGSGPTGGLPGSGPVGGSTSGSTGGSTGGSTSGTSGGGTSTGSATGDLVGTIAPLPVSNTVAPVTNAVAPVLAPVVQAAAPVTAPVTEAVAPVTEPVTQAVAPVTEPVTQAVDPVLEPVTGTVGGVVGGLLG